MNKELLTKTTEQHKTIIKLYDNENYEYPLISIKEGHMSDFKKALRDCQNSSCSYNIDDFIIYLESCEWFIETISEDEEVFF